MNIQFYTDGATEGYNGKLGTVTHVGIGVYSPQLNLKISKRMKGISNNEAEFLALIEALLHCRLNKIEEAHFFLDSKIVVNRANGSRPKGKNKNRRMDSFQDTVLSMAEGGGYRFSWISREKNAIADVLSKQSLYK